MHSAKTAGLKWDILTIKRPGLSRDLPPGKEALMWVANSSTLIYGEHDAVLVDTFLTTVQSQTLLDWVVGSGELVDKPVAILNASPMATYAQASLTETLTVMSARVITAASLTIPIQGKHLDETGIVADPQLSRLVLQAIKQLISAIERSAPNAHDCVGSAE